MPSTAVDHVSLPEGRCSAFPSNTVSAPTTEAVSWVGVGVGVGVGEGAGVGVGVGIGVGVGEGAGVGVDVGIGVEEAS